MKYKIEIKVAVPRPVFIEKMDSIENLKHWQEGLLEARPITDIQGEAGSKMKLRYKMNNREIEMVEKIISINLPESMTAEYTTRGVKNIQHNTFVDNADGTTTWIADNEFIFSSLALKVMGFLMPKAFKKQSYKYMKAFKNFAENGTSLVEEA